MLSCKVITRQRLSQVILGYFLTLTFEYQSENEKNRKFLNTPSAWHHLSRVDGISSIAIVLCR